MATQTQASELLDVVDAFYRTYGEADFDLWDEILDPAYVGAVNGHMIPNREAGKGFAAALLKAFPDIRYTVEDTVMQDNRVVSRWSATATHSGEFAGMAPTNKTITMLGITIFRIDHGKIVELWGVWDQHGLIQQLAS